MKSLLRDWIFHECGGWWLRGEQNPPTTVIPIQGIGNTMCQNNSEAIRTRLNRIEGQVRGVGQMVADDRYCVDILHQVHAIKAALAKVETEILKAHAACCVEEAIVSGDAEAQRKKFNELIEVLAKAKL
ncbi:metal-sensitive transcriptional regulator [Brucella anthropi]|uniref:metal-sensitive transcriptional regulator n=2 Tax=Brucella TaxID=234 RepID=UPI00286D4C69|nr:metal-sensitive transcriptional regulator [Brucella anthropi]